MVATASPSATTTRRVSTLLAAPEHVPDAAEWQRLGPEAADELRAIARDERALVLRRGRAVTALAHFPNVATHQTLVALVRDERAPWLLRGKAAQSLASAYPAEAIEHLAPLLAHPETRLREAAIKAVGSLESAESRAALATRADVESKPYLVALIRDSLSRGGAR
jgi:HEAT repeat protein